MSRLLETFSLFVLLALVGLRPLVSESYDPGGTALQGVLESIAAPQPLATLCFDLLILCSALACAVARALEGRRHRPIGIEWGAAIVAIAAIASCGFAGNKRLAINATVDWLCYPLLAMTLVNLVRTLWHRRLLLGVLLGSAFVQATHCFEQSFVSFDETWAHYQSTKAEFWGQQGVDLNSLQVELFEQRILAGEASGFLPHSNIAGSYLVLTGVLAVGAFVASRRRRESGLRAIVLGVVGIVILCSVWLTRSLGAVVSLVGGAALAATIYLFYGWFNANRMRAIKFAWGLAALGVAATIGHGAYHGSLPGASLKFRWQYWQASADMVADNPLVGVGRENFGRNYLAYKTIESAEEVANPHNLFVQAATDWGLIGLVGLIVMLVGASVAMTRVTLHTPAPSRSRLCLDAGTVSARTRSRHGCDETSASSVWGLWGWVIALFVGVVLCRIPLLGTGDPDFIYYTTVTTGAAWLLGFGAVVFKPHLLTSRPHLWDATVCVAAGVGLFTFVLHDLVNFAFFVPATATTAFAALALCVASKLPCESTPDVTPTRTRWLGVGALGVTIVAVTTWIVVPVARSSQALQDARAGIALAQESPKLSAGVDYTFVHAALCDRLDPTPCAERAVWLATLSIAPDRSNEPLRAAVASIELAIQRDPRHLKLRRMLAQIRLRLAQRTSVSDDFAAAIRAAEDAIGIYPSDPEGYAFLANCQALAGRAGLSKSLINEAIENYQRALDLDALRPPWVEMRGFQPEEKRAIEEKIVRMRSE